MPSAKDGDAMDLGEALTQAQSISRLEGLAPDALTRALHEAIAAGRVSSHRAVDELCEYARIHQTLDGFMESRPW